jgi:hypothetical protein
LAAEPLRLPFVIGTDTPEQRHCEKLIFTNWNVNIEKKTILRIVLLKE